jgi:hypothetical protein
MLRSRATDLEIKAAIIAAVQNRFINGHVTEQFSQRDAEPSMAAIGG